MNMKPKVLYVYRSGRRNIVEDWRKGKVPDSMLFGINHLWDMGYEVDFFDTAYLWPRPVYWLTSPLEKTIIKQTGMGFKLDQALTLLPRVRAYDVIVCTGDSSGLPLLWLKSLGFIKKPIIHMASGLIGALRAHPNSWVVGFYRRFMKWVDVLTVYANVEKEYFVHELNVPDEKVCYIPYGTDWKYWSRPSKLKRSIIGAAGIDRGRDYATLFEAVKDLDINVEVACHASNVKGLAVPKNVKVRVLIDYQKVRNLFRRSKIVVVPMKERGRSAGQMVVLEAASAQAPVIASSVRGITEAFDLERNKHIAYVPPQNPRALREEIMYLLDQPNVRKSMGSKSSRFIRDNYTTEHLAENLAALIDQLKS